MTELLPCPFCGYEASISEVESAGGNGRIIQIVGCNSEDCDVSFHGHARKVDAAKAWNTRFATAEVTPYREALRAVIQCFEDLERDVRTAYPEYKSFPMADKALANAKALLTDA